MDLDWLSRKALDRHMVYAAIAALAAVLPLSALGTGLLVRRLRRVAATARRITDGELDARTGGPGWGRDEIADISVAVDQMAGSLERRLRSEQRFTADEIARYGTLIAWAEELGHEDIVRFLTTNLNEEKAANTKLNTVALRKGVNRRAAS